MIPYSANLWRSVGLFASFTWRMALTREGAFPLESISRKSGEALSPTNSSLSTRLSAAVVPVLSLAGEERVSDSIFENSAAREELGATFCSKAASVEAPKHWTRLCSRVAKDDRVIFFVAGENINGPFSIFAIHLEGGKLALCGGFG